MPTTTYVKNNYLFSRNIINNDYDKCQTLDLKREKLPSSYTQKFHFPRHTAPKLIQISTC